jgi:hypothetical protein
MKDTLGPCVIPRFVMMRVIKDVHSIEPVILIFFNHCRIITCTGETLIRLTVAYNIIISSVRTGRTSSLGNRVMASYLCHNWRVGCKISLHRGDNLPRIGRPESSSHIRLRLKPMQACSREIAQRRWKPRVQLRSFHETRYRTPWDQNEIADTSSWRVRETGWW